MEILKIVILVASLAVCAHSLSKHGASLMRGPTNTECQDHLYHFVTRATACVFYFIPTLASVWFLWEKVFK